MVRRGPDRLCNSSTTASSCSGSTSVPFQEPNPFPR
jgi:hypothetical protein